MVLTEVAFSKLQFCKATLQRCMLVAPLNYSFRIVVCLFVTLQDHDYLNSRKRGMSKRLTRDLPLVKLLNISITMSPFLGVDTTQFHTSLIDGTEAYWLSLPSAPQGQLVRHERHTLSYCKPLSCVHSNPHLNFELRFMYFHLVCCCGRQYKEPTTFLFHAKYSFPWQWTFLTLLKHSIRSNMKPDRDLGIFSSCIADSLQLQFDQIKKAMQCKRSRTKPGNL